MKILLLKDLGASGKKGDIINISSGYARNYILPKKIGKVVTENDVKEQSRIIEKKEVKLEEKIEELKKATSELKNMKIEMFIKVGKDGSIFKAINENDIVKKIYSQIKPNYSRIKEEDIKVELKPIKEIGEFVINVILGKGNSKIATKTKLKIFPEKN